MTCGFRPPERSIQIGADRHEVKARITEGAQRDELWQSVVVERAPTFAKYEERSGRVIPIAVLTRHM
jgi:hypothetical protein